MISEKNKKLLTVVSVLSFLGVVVASYLTYLHYEPSASDFCNFGEQFNCDIVNKSIYASIDLGFMEVPVAVLGLLTYIFFFVMTVLLLKKFDFQNIHKSLAQKNIVSFLKWFSVVGLAFSLYLTYIEAFVLKTWCIFCVTSQILILFITILFFATNSISKKAS